jgi:hypothetical protein
MKHRDTRKSLLSLKGASVKLKIEIIIKNEEHQKDLLLKFARQKRHARGIYNCQLAPNMANIDNGMNVDF